MPFIRVINYHETPGFLAGAFERQLQHFLTRFEAATRADLENLLAGRGWKSRKPGLIITFDDGLRCNAEVAAPLLEKYGFSGWFFVPPDFMDTPPADQIRFADEHRILCNAPNSDGRIAMTWDQARALTRKHQIGCHTASHYRMVASTSNLQLNREIVTAKEILEERLGQPVESFCWVGGEEHVYHSRAAAIIRAAGYSYSFMTNTAVVSPTTSRFQLQRTNIEAAWGSDVVDFQLSGLLDLMYWPKRGRVNRLTAADEDILK